jgi:5-methylcytosine-specific restriction enzyme subunit McrC
MLHLKVTEYERITRVDQNRKFLTQLQDFDERWSRSTGDTIFDWNDRRFVKAKNHVGVIAVPGGTIEILPKIDKSDNEDKQPQARQNLLYMLSITRNIIGEERDLAAIGNQKMPLLEQLITLFAERTLKELRRGIDHSYVTQEENIHQLKGKLIVSQHAVKNAVHQERVYCRYDIFISDTVINRILKASCRILLSLSRSTTSQKKLREIVFLLDEVTDLDIAEHHFSDIHYNRNTERFKSLCNFSMLIIKGMSPIWTKGKDVSFSLLFPMEKLFEEFIARYIHRYAEELGFLREKIHVQAVGRREWLLQRENDNRDKFQLKPDFVVDDEQGKPRLILDTKWKHLKSDNEDSKNGVSQSDIYQLYAYAHRYQCPENILLFPKVDGATAKSYIIKEGYCSHQIRIEFVDLDRDLREERAEFQKDLREILTKTKQQHQS